MKYLSKPNNEITRRNNAIVEVGYRAVKHEKEDFLETRDVREMKKSGNKLLKKIKMYSIIIASLYIIMIITGVYMDVKSIGYNRETKKMNPVVIMIKDMPITRHINILRKRVIVFNHYGWEKATEPDEFLLRSSYINTIYDDIGNKAKTLGKQFDSATESFKKEYKYYNEKIEGVE